jgi:protease PrsW
MNETAAPAVPNAGVEPRSGTPSRRPGWLRVLVGGLVLWLATVVVTFATRNSNLVPTVILLGSFLVPVAFVTFAFSRAGEAVTLQRILSAFCVGGVLGVLGASLLEAEFLRQPSLTAYLRVGLIEEAVKLTALWLLSRRLSRYTMRDGIVLGAAVGMGFAALESAGYAFNAMFTSSGLSLFNVVETEVLRAILAPLGHGLWTAILGGVLFRAATRHSRLRPTRALLGWYVIVALLHALWDASRGIAVWLTLLITNTPLQWLIIQSGRPPAVTPEQVHIYTVLTWVLMGLDALLGLVLLRGRWRQATAWDEPDTATLPAVTAQPGPAS